MLGKHHMMMMPLFVLAEQQIDMPIPSYVFQEPFFLLLCDNKALKH
jgi:hypothetical protein